MQDSWDQMIEVLDKQSKLLELKEQSKDQGSHEISENQSEVLHTSPTIQESNMLEGALSTKIEFEDLRTSILQSMWARVNFYVVESWGQDSSEGEASVVSQGQWQIILK